MSRRFLGISGCVCITLSWLGASLCVWWGGLEEGRAELYYNAYLLRFAFGSFLCLFAFSFAWSVGLLGLTVSVEFFPLRARARASSLALSCLHASMWGSLWLLTSALDSRMSVLTCVLLFAAVALALALFVTVAVPDTKGDYHITHTPR